MAVLAKASSLAGALIGGLAAGFLIYVSTSLDKSAYRSDAVVSAATLVASLLLIAAALYLEFGCRVRNGPDRDQDAEPGQPPHSGAAH